MTDVMTPEQRSRCMSRIKGKNTGPEIRLRRVLWGRGYRYRLHYNLPGKPDIVFAEMRTVIFVDGCFWHGCPEHSVKPKTNKEFWEKKLRGNMEKDKDINDRLKADGWRVIRFWEHEINKNVERVADEIVRVLDEAAGERRRCSGS